MYVEHSNSIADKSKEDNAHDLIFKLQMSKIDISQIWW